MIKTLRASQRRADALLVTATHNETSVLLEQAERQLHRPHRLFFDHVNSYYDLGCLSGTRLVVAQCEMRARGPGGSVLAVHDAIKDTSTTSVILVGLAFGMDNKRQRIGDVLISRQLQLYELRRQQTCSGPSGIALVTPTGDPQPASPRLLQRFQNSAPHWHQGHIEFGLMLSGDKPVDHVSFRDSLLASAPEAIGGELEGPGAFAAADVERIDWIVAKAISEWADGSTRDHNGECQYLAISNATAFVLATLQAGGIAHRATAQLTLTVEMNVWSHPASPPLLPDVPSAQAPTSHIGDGYSLRFVANDDCYVTVLRIGAAGTVSRLSPVTPGDDGFITGGSLHHIPSRGQSPFIVGGPPGVQTILAFATRGPHALPDASRRDGLIVCSAAHVVRIERDFLATDAADRAKAICEMTVCAGSSA